MGTNPRAVRLAERIKVIIARAIERGHIKDPRLGFVTITDVRVSGDLQHATVFYTVLGSDEERAETATALASATKSLRMEVGRNITARLTPTLEFVADAVPENANQIEALLREARERDEASAALAAGAAYAGEADPYVKPREDDEE